MKPVIEFDKAWLRLATEGVVDPRGGPEYRRVFSLWMGQHQPDETDDFIRSNVTATGGPAVSAQINAMKRQIGQA